MNIALWILQAALAFFYLSGGAYKAFKFEELATQMSMLPHGAWRAVGILEMVGAVLLIVPAATKWMPQLTPIAAGVLAVETLAISGVYARYSLKMGAENPLTWSLPMLLGVLIVAFGRYALTHAA